MKKEIKFGLLCTFLSVSQLNYAQRATYTYDNSGNRIRRQIIRIQNSGTETASQLHNTQNESMFELIDVSYGKDYNTLLVNIKDSEMSECNITIRNIEGKLQLEKNTESMSTTIDISNLPSGIYVVNIVYRNEKKSWKIFK